MLGMYVHTHWGYHHPYAARTWRPADWEGCLEGLTALGYDLVMLWPQLDCMPPEPNESDRAFLDTIGRMIELAHQRFGLRVVIVACGNTIGNERAAAYTFPERPYFVCEKRVNPKDPAEVDAFRRGRRNQFAPLRQADALAIIDSDPGGFIGSTNDEFVMLMQAQADVFRSFNPAAEVIYWMLAGWETYNRFWAEASASGEATRHADPQKNDFAETLALMQQQVPEPWSLFASTPDHNTAIDRLDLRQKATWFPYGVIEGEPTFPLTNCDRKGLAGRLAPEALGRYPRGVMANAQTHCLQLPHIYIFAHLAEGGTVESLDLEGFAEQMLPGQGEALSRAWLAIEARDPDAQRAAAGALRDLVGQTGPTGPFSGLLFGDADRLLTDTAMGLELRAQLIDLRTAVDAGTEVPQALRRALDTLQPYQERVGFVDAYGGPLYDELNTALAELDDPGLDAVLERFHNWQDPSVRNGLVLRLFDATHQYCLAHET